MAKLIKFFSWWGSELFGMLPSSMRGADASLAACPVLSVESGGVRLLKSRALPADFPFINQLAPEPHILASLGEAHRVKPIGGVVLRFPYTMCFARRIEIPNAAASKAAHLLAINLEQATPFKTKDVLTAHIIEKAAASPGKVWVRHLIMKRAPVEKLKASIQFAGLNVLAVDCWDESGAEPVAVNFLTSIQNKPAPKRGVDIALAAVVIVLAGLGAYLLVDKYESALSSIEAETTPLKARVQQKRDAEAREKAARSEAANIEQLQKDTASRVQILDQLTRLLPDTAYLTDLKIEGNTVDIAGLAKTSAALIPIFERSSFFSDATSTAPLTFDPAQSMERFSIRMQVRNSVPAKADKGAEPNQ